MTVPRATGACKAPPTVAARRRTHALRVHINRREVPRRVMNASLLHLASTSPLQGQPHSTELMTRSARPATTASLDRGRQHQVMELRSLATSSTLTTVAHASRASTVQLVLPCHFLAHQDTCVRPVSSTSQTRTALLAPIARKEQARPAALVHLVSIARHALRSLFLVLQVHGHLPQPIIWKRWESAPLAPNATTVTRSPARQIPRRCQRRPPRRVSQVLSAREQATVATRTPTHEWCFARQVTSVPPRMRNLDKCPALVPVNTRTRKVQRHARRALMASGAVKRKSKDASHRTTVPPSTALQTSWTT